ncbi:MAG: hypothetical protein WDW36_004324 [Sanguina aurantia]
MSLFKARDWWRVQCGTGEEFDGGCMCIGNVDGDPSGAVKIVTGSLQGNLRIYAPRERDYKPEDLLLELELDQAILQLALGKFAGSGGTQLAVLHPKRLTVYSVVAQGTSYLQLNKQYEHTFEHTAANMTHGGFGGLQGLDHFCVQSYDGQLSFFECEVAAFSRFLPSFLIPGPLCYCPQSDSFITCSAAMELECYKYKVLATATGEKSSAPTSSQQASKRLQCDWKVILGEAALDIRMGRFSAGLQGFQSDIIVLGERNMFVVSNSGQIIFQKRLEYHPACCNTYPVPGSKAQGGAENLMVVTHTANLLVYRGSQLCWAAKMDTQPVAVAISDFGGVRGMITSMDDKGALVVAYLGTDPQSNPVGFSEGKEPDFEAIAQEHRHLAAVIREASSGTRPEPPDMMTLRAQVPQTFDSTRNDRDSYSGGSGSRPTRTLTLRLYIMHDGPDVAEDIVVSVSVPAPLTLEQPTIRIPLLPASTREPVMFPVPITLRHTGSAPLPSSATATFLASWTSKDGQPRCAHLAVALPLCLFVGLVAPVKSAAFKLTITTNRSPPPLPSLFEDLMAVAPQSLAQSLASGASAGGGVVTLQYHSGQEVTILVSKGGGRYRLQSDCFEAIWLVLHELALRLTSYYDSSEGEAAPGPAGPFCIQYEDALPMNDFFEVVEQHWGARCTTAMLQKQLSDRAVQFRNVEKRLLMRFKDKNPAVLSQLDFLLEETYLSLQELGSALDAAQSRLKAASLRLSAAVELVLRLIRYRFSLSEPEYTLLRAFLSPEVHDGSEAGWEEHTEGAMTQLLRTCLAKNAKEAAVVLAPLAASKDTGKLKKHILLVLERLSRGMRLAAGGGAGGEVGQREGERGQQQQQPLPLPLPPRRGRDSFGGGRSFVRGPGVAVPVAVRRVQSSHAWVCERGSVG